MTITSFLLISLLTIIAYRIGTYCVIYLWGNTAWWRRVRNDPWNHYQLGFILIIAGLLLSFNALSPTSFRETLIAIGIGMIIDEITDLIRLFHLYPLKSTFRDSFGDLVLIVITYLLFSAIVLLGSRVF